MATVWHNGHPTGLGYLTLETGPAPVGSYAYGISADGSTLVGDSVDPLANYQSVVAVAWRNGVLTALDIVGRPPGACGDPALRNVVRERDGTSFGPQPEDWRGF